MVQNLTLLHKVQKWVPSWWQPGSALRATFQDVERGVLVLTTLFVVGSAILPSNKLFFVFATLYFLGLVWLTLSVTKAMFYAFLPLGMIGIGQVYTLTVIPFNSLEQAVGYEGRQLFFRFSPYFVLLLTAIGLLAAHLFTRRRYSFTWTHLLLFLAVLFKLVSALSTPHYQLYALATAIGLAGLSCWAVLMQFWLRSTQPRERYQVWKTFCLLILLMSFVQTSVGVAQYFKRSTLNLRIEQSTVIPNFGAGADENRLRFRPIGLQTHANELANSSLVLLFAGLVIINWLRTSGKPLPHSVELFFVVTLLAILILCQSRAAYLALFASGLYFWVREYRTSRQLLHFLDRQLKPFIFVILLAVIYTVPLVTERLIYTVNSFGEGGGVTTRAQLEKVGLEMWNQRPLLGVGPGMFIPAAFDHSPLGIMRYFPESLHNGFFLHLVESGLLATLAIVGFWYLLFRQVHLVGSDHLQRSIMTAGMLALAVMMWFHPFDNFLTFFQLTTWIIVYSQETTNDAKAA